MSLQIYTLCLSEISIICTLFFAMRNSILLSYFLNNATQPFRFCPDSKKTSKRNKFKNVFYCLTKAIFLKCHSIQKAITCIVFYTSDLAQFLSVLYLCILSNFWKKMKSQDSQILRVQGIQKICLLYTSFELNLCKFYYISRIQGPWTLPSLYYRLRFLQILPGGRGPWTFPLFYYLFWFLQIPPGSWGPGPSFYSIICLGSYRFRQEAGGPGPSFIILSVQVPIDPARRLGALDLPSLYIICLGSYRSRQEAGGPAPFASFEDLSDCIGESSPEEIYPLPGHLHFFL